MKPAYISYGSIAHLEAYIHQFPFGHQTPKVPTKKEMEGIRKVARAHYQAGSRRVQTLAHNFFNAMDRNGDGQISFQEFMTFMSQEGHAGMDNPYFFQALDRDRNGTLDFWEVMTLYYIVKSGRPFCNLCRVFITGIYFTCVDCFESPRGSFCLCLTCYPSRNWNHSHNGRCQFLDNYTLLEVKKVSAMNQTSQPSNAQYYNNAQAPNVATYYVPPSNAIVPVHQGNNNVNCIKSQWMIAFKAFETALSLGNLGASVAPLCNIL